MTQKPIDEETRHALALYRDNLDKAMRREREIFFELEAAEAEFGDKPAGMVRVTLTFRDAEGRDKTARAPVNFGLFLAQLRGEYKRAEDQLRAIAARNPFE